ncbi:MAG: DUF3899 domain-containing protein [Clostridia bacterium]
MPFDESKQLIPKDDVDKERERQALKRYKLKNYLITAAISVIFLFLCMFAVGLFKSTETADILMALCDSFFIVAVIITGLGLLIFTGNKGTFDMIVYGIKFTVSSIFVAPEKRKIRNFAEYKEKKHVEDVPFMHMIFIGLGYLVVSLAFLIAYYCVV